MLWALILVLIYGLFSKKYKRLIKYEKAKRKIEKDKGKDRDGESSFTRTGKSED